MEYRTIGQLSEAVRIWSRSLPLDVDLIAGIPRSGMLPATMLALYLNLPVTDLDGLLAGRVLSHGMRVTRHDRTIPGDFKHVLIVDDSCDSGRAMDSVRKRLDEVTRPFKYSLGAVYVTDRYARASVDYWAERVPRPRAFEWNILSHPKLKEACFDLDGVFCRDPLGPENDDGENYLRFITEVTPMYVPPVRVGHIVTSRLESYRPQTEDWLRRSGIEYGCLHMMSGVTARERADRRMHAAFKAGIYREADAWLFVESSLSQAREIVDRSRKPVFCVEIYDLLQPSSAYAQAAAEVRAAGGRLRDALVHALQRV